MGQQGVSQANGRKRKIEEIRATARFGNFPIPAEMGPAEILLDEVRRSAGFCMWIESKMAEWPDELIRLGESNLDDKGSMQVFPTNDAGWIDIYQRERKHLVTVAKMCLDVGISERQVQLAEKQSAMMFMLINEAFEMLSLSPEQKAAVPQIMPVLIRRIAIPQLEAEKSGD